MTHLDAYRDASAVLKVLSEIKKTATRPWVLMEVCGGQTHNMIRYGLDQLLSPHIELIHGPGCPVCVTPLAMIDKAITLASRKEVILVSYGDMLRVPGSVGMMENGDVVRDLLGVKSLGGDVRMVYSPLEAVQIAKENPDRVVVFFAIGFETTAPANALAILQAAGEGVTNFCALVSHVTVPPAICAMMSAPDCRVNGFLAAGHVCTVMGVSEYEALAARYRVPIVVTGFEPLDLVYGILLAVRQLEQKQFRVENAYARMVAARGNVRAQQVIRAVFEVCDRAWRGLGVIPKSGYQLRPHLAAFDAECRFPEVEKIQVTEPEVCRSGDILQGRCKPDACAAFGKQCTPVHPLGALMVSGEGACAAYYKYGRMAL